MAEQTPGQAPDDNPEKPGKQQPPNPRLRRWRLRRRRRGAQADPDSWLAPIVRRATWAVVLMGILLILFCWKHYSANAHARQRIYESLIGRLDDPNEHVRASAAHALGKLGDAKAAGHLVKLADDPLVAPAAMDAIDKLGVEIDFSSVRDTETQEPGPIETGRVLVRDALDTSPAWVRLVAFLIAAVVVLLPLAGLVRWANRRYLLFERLAEFMQRLRPGMPSSGTLKKVSNITLFIVAPLIVYGINAFYLTKYAVPRDQASAMQVAITKIELAGRRKQASALPMLMRVLDDEEKAYSDDAERSQLRWRSAYSIGQIGNPRGLETVLSHLDDNDRRVRQYCAWAVGNIAGVDANRQDEAMPLVLRFCTYCKEPIKNEYRFCPNCRQPIDRTFQADEWNAAETKPDDE